MSQINSFNKSVATATEKLVYHMTTIDDFNEGKYDNKFLMFQKYFLEEFTPFHQDLNENLLVTGTQIQVKMKAVDPVTGQKRYGPQTEQKFNESFAKLEEVIQQVNPWKSDLDLMYQESKQKYEEQLMLERRRLEEEHQRQTEEKKRQEEERLRIIEVEKQKERESLELLRKQAEVIRKRKLDEFNLLKKLEDKIPEELNRIVSLFNEKCSKKELIIPYLDQVKVYCNQHEKKYPLKAATNMIVTILDRIVSRPDDEQARKLRLTHQVLQSRLTGVKGSIQLLIACGFTLHLRVSSSVTGNNATSVAHNHEERKRPHAETVNNSNDTDTANLVSIQEIIQGLQSSLLSNNNSAAGGAADANSTNQLNNMIQSILANENLPSIMNTINTTLSSAMHGNSGSTGRSNYSPTLLVKDQRHAIEEKLIAVIPELTEEDNLLEAVELLLFPNTKFELFLEMEEPVIEEVTSVATNNILGINGRDQWVQWFDNLKDNLTTIQQML